MSPASECEPTPYKGPLSYEIEDADYFFGREREAGLLASKILCSRFSLLHAQSGTGKTSLINARVIPALEEQGWTALRVLPRGLPSEAVRISVLLGLLPPPAAERAALDRVLELFWPPGDDPAIGEILERFDHGIPVSDPRRRVALLPVESSIQVRSAGLSYAGPLRPLWLRLLRATLELSQYAEHLNAISGPRGIAIEPDTRASELRAALSDPAMIEAHEQLAAELYIPTPSLLEFLTNVIEQYGRKRTQFGLVLILDQFEELFTLFSDSLARPDQKLWRLRWEFLDQLEDLYKAGTSLPLRYVISMRDEYIAQLDPVRRFVRDLDANAFHLSFLEREEAHSAIREPAKLFGFEYSEECYVNILNALVREDRFVEPAPLQIVCERLWRDKSVSLIARETGNVKTIVYAALPEGGTRAILDTFFDEALNAAGDLKERLETLEMLEPLVTSRGTRNIVEYESLVKAPFRSAGRRIRLLGKLSALRIVRIEQRLGGEFVEIAHEFLIPSILRKIRTVLNPDPDYGKFRAALRTLERFEDIDFRANSRQLLTRHIFQDLDAVRGDIEWNAWGTELMFRSAVVWDSGAQTVVEWANRYQSVVYDGESEVVFNEGRMRRGARTLLSAEELAALDEKPDAELNADQVEMVLRSYIARSGDSEGPRIARWARELERLCEHDGRF